MVDGPQVVHEFTTPEDVSLHQLVIAVGEAPGPFHFDAGRMVVGDLPVHTAGGGQRLGGEIGRQGLDLLDDGADIRLLQQVADLALAEAGVVHPAEEVHAARAVIDIDRGVRVVELLDPERLLVGQVHIEAEALAFPLDGADAHDGAHGRVILRAGVVDDLDALDLVAQDAVQFGGVGHSPAIDIDLGRALADDFDAVPAFDDARNLAQDVARRARVLQHGPVHGGGEAFARELGLGHHGLHDGFAEQLLVLFQADRGEFLLGLVQRDRLRGVLEADQGDGEGVGALRGLELEATVFAGGGADDQHALRVGQERGGEARGRAALFDRAPAQHRFILPGRKSVRCQADQANQK